MTDHESSQVSMTLPINKLVPSPTNPRKSFPEDKLQEMANSIIKVGLLSPILVRTAREGKHEIVAGETRWRAAKIAGLSEVQVTVRELTDYEAMEVQILENLHRNDLSPLEEAHGFKNLLEKSQEGIAGYTIDELADKIGKSRTYVYDSLKLTELPEVAVKALNESKLNRSTALMIARLDPRVQTSALSTLVNKAEPGSPIPVRQAKDLIKYEANKSTHYVQADQEIADLTALGHRVIDIREKQLEQEWAEYGISSAHWKHKEGYLSLRETLPSPAGFLGRSAEFYVTDSDATKAVYLVGADYHECKVIALYPSDLLMNRHQAAIDAGTLDPSSQVQIQKSEHTLKQEKRQAIQDERVRYAHALMDQVHANPLPSITLLVLKTLLRKMVEELDLGLIDSRYECELSDVIEVSNDLNELSALALNCMIAIRTDTPYWILDKDFEPEENDAEWLEVLEIAALHGVAPLAAPYANEQPATPPAAAQAQDQDAPEEKPCPATEAAGQLSDEEAALSSTATAAQAPVVVALEDEQLSPGHLRAKERGERRAAKRLLKKESAKADLSKLAPAASAAGETNSSEVAA